MRLISATADFNAAVLFFLPALSCQPFPLEGFDLICRTSTLPGLWPGFFLFRPIPVVSGLLTKSPRSRISTLVWIPPEAVAFLLAYAVGVPPPYSISIVVLRTGRCTALTANFLSKCLLFKALSR